jgi:hypothetical protein
MHREQIENIFAKKSSGYPGKTPADRFNLLDSAPETFFGPAGIVRLRRLFLPRRYPPGFNAAHTPQELKYRKQPHAK